MARRPPALALALAAVLAAAGSAAAGDATGRARAAICGPSCYAAPAGTGALLLFTGHGAGHGVGMSQYGAYGYAQNGWSYDRILAHYYPGTTLGTTSVPTLRVLLASDRKTLMISSTAPITVTDGTGATHTLAAGKASLDPGLELAVDGQPAQPLSPPLTFAPTAGATLTLGRAYRGKLVVDVVGGKLRAIDVVGLEQYLDGVVPAEMPPSWSPAALEAQAVASRSFALATRTAGAPFDVYGDSRSQLYLGVAAEKPTTTAAVAATAGQVLLYGGKVATTPYSSTSGGRTESAADVWGGRAVPYLVSVPDPYDGISPYHDWGPVALTAQTAARDLGVTGRIVDATTTPNAAGRVATLDVVTAGGSAGPAVPTGTPVAGTVAAAKLGLPSTWFAVGVLSLAAPPAGAPMSYGTKVTLTGLARGVGGVVLEQRPFGRPWSDVAPATPSAGGAIAVVQAPAITTDYRLATSSAATAYVRIRVSPRVSLTAPQSASVVAGTERPVLPRAPVLVQEQNASAPPAWTTVVRGTVDASGSFSVAVSLSPGTYRAVVAPGHGFSPGASAVVTVAG